MLGEEIKKIIDKNNERIKDIMHPGTFVLNKEVHDLIMQNMALQEECPHKYKNGICIYCYKEEEEINE